MKRKNALKLLLAPIALSALAFGVMEMNSEPLSASASTEVQLVEIDEKAAIRTATPYGIRFIGSVNATVEEAKAMTLGADVEFTYNGQDYSTEVTADNTKLYEQTAGGEAYFNIALVDLADDAFNVEFSVQAWVQETATSEKVYSATTATRSIAYVAGRAKQAGETAAILDTIINTASANFTLSTEELAMKTGQIQAVSVSGTKVDVVKYEISDTSVATVDNAGNVTAIKAGNTKLTVTIGNNQRTCNITVSDPVATKLDLTGASGLTLGGYELTVGEDFVVSDVLALPDLFAAIPDTAEEIVAYKQVIGETVTPLTAAGNANELKGVQAGESTQFRFEEADGDYYYADLPVYTLVISDKDELLNMTSILDANKVDEGTVEVTNSDKTTTTYPVFSSGGYFVLENDIGLSGNFNSEFKLAGANRGISTKNGFTGVFDGRGYTISGLSIPNNTISTDENTGVSLKAYGLFSGIAKSGVVKNVMLTGRGATSEGYTSFIGMVVYGTLQNVAIKTTGNSYTVNNVGIICSRATSTAFFENVIVDITNKPLTFSGSEWGLLWRYVDDETTVKGVYVIGARTDQKRSANIWCGSSQNKNMLAAITYSGGNAAYFSSVDNFKNNLETTAFVQDTTDTTVYTETTKEHKAWDYINNKFSTDIWNLEGDIPVVYHKEA